MLLLTLLALEGMARIAYYAAYGPGYGGGDKDVFAAPLVPFDSEAAPPRWIRHPFSGSVRNWPNNALNEMPPARRREDTVVIGFLGGSVAEHLLPYLRRALNRWFAANNQPRQPVVIHLAMGSSKQPQQTMMVANTLLLGGEFDLIVNLDGFNEMVDNAYQDSEYGIFPVFPHSWHNREGLTPAEELLAGRIGRLRREQARLIAAGATSPLRRSALFGLANRYRRERTERRIIQLNHELAAGKAAYSLEKHGPRSWLEGAEEVLPAAARIWYRSSIALARLAELVAADYYHFLQPNQYVPGAKPLSAEELELAYKPQGVFGTFAGKGYPLLRAFSRDLQSQGVNYFDLTGIFADHPETLYRDACCHLNPRGNELLAAAIVRRLEPSLRRRGGERPAMPDSALAAARRPAEPDRLLVSGAFQVYLQEDAKLRYVRADCAPADMEARFFLHLTPRDPADLPPHRRSHGYDNQDFSFAETFGYLWQGQCQTLLRLPNYPVAALRTGQYIPYAGELWAGEFSFPE